MIGIDKKLYNDKYYYFVLKDVCDFLVIDSESNIYHNGDNFVKAYNKFQELTGGDLFK